MFAEKFNRVKKSNLAEKKDFVHGKTMTKNSDKSLIYA